MGSLLAILICMTTVPSTRSVPTPGAKHASFASPVPPPVTAPELYFLLMNQNPNTPYNVSAATSLFERAHASGYTGVVLYDHSLEALGSPHLKSGYLDSLKAVMAQAKRFNLEVIPQIYSFGHSAGMVFYNINLTEPTFGSQNYVVASDGVTLTAKSSTPSLMNGDFSEHTGNRFSGWQLQEGVGVRTFVDSTQPRGPTMSLSLRIATQGAGSARVMQTFAVPPVDARGVSATCFIRGENLDLSPTAQAAKVDLRMQLNFDGDDNCERWLPNPRMLCKDNNVANCSFGWRQESVACSRVNTSTTNLNGNITGNLELWLGIWGNNTLNGSVWFSNCTLSANAGIVNLLRREGSPITLTTPKIQHENLIEGTDFNRIPTTPQSVVMPMGTFPSDSAPLVITLPKATTRLRPGDSVTADYFSVPPGQPTACLTSNASQQFLVDNAQQHVDLFGKNAQYLVRYDEFQQLHSCNLCRAKAATAGKLLAWHATLSANVLAKVASPKRVMVWSDMFDPYHNGNRSSFIIKGGVTGAWEGLSKAWVIANWDHSNTGISPTGECTVLGKCQTKSLQWFESLRFSQFICGYYGSGNGTHSAMTELQNAKGVKGLLGMIYGPWAQIGHPSDPYFDGDYSQLESYAEAARKYWP